LIKDSDPNFTGDDTREGMTALVSIKHPDPQFESQTKVKLMNPEVQTLAAQVIVRLSLNSSMKIHRQVRRSSRSVSLRPAHAMRPVKPATWSSASRHSKP
jgi:DNA gyrase/topoisomerase IV subunit B